MFQLTQSGQEGFVQADAETGGIAESHWDRLSGRLAVRPCPTGPDHGYSLLFCVIERLPGTHRYTVTEYGLRIALFYSRTHSRILRSGLAMTFEDVPCAIQKAFLRLQQTIDQHCERTHLAAGTRLIC